MSAIRVWYADGPNSPRTSPRDAAAAAGLPGDAELEVTLGWTIERHPWLDAIGPAAGITASTVLAGYGLSSAVNAGTVTPNALQSAPAAPEDSGFW